MTVLVMKNIHAEHMAVSAPWELTVRIHVHMYKLPCVTTDWLEWRHAGNHLIKPLMAHPQKTACMRGRTKRLFMDR